jgi:hypothetical protein
MTGHVRRRGDRSWEIKFDLGTDPLTGKRLTRYHSFKGTKREAEGELIRLKAGVDKGEYVDPSKLTVAQFLDRWEEWAAGQVSAKTLEQTNEGLRFKAPKTKAGRRQVTIPASIVAELRAHWRRQQEQRLALGMGKAAKDDLVFPRPDGAPFPPDYLTSEWARAVRTFELPKVTLHALRHTHVSQLIATGLDVVTVSRRIGHSNPTVTLTVYAHLFGNTDERAANAVEAAMAGLLTE